MKENFESVLKRKRVEKGYTLQKLSELSGITYVQINNLENGKNKPTALTISRLAKALECSYEELFELTLK